MTVDIPVFSYNWGNNPKRTIHDFTMARATGAKILAGSEGRDRTREFEICMNIFPDISRVPFEGPGVDDTPVFYRNDLVTLEAFHSTEVDADPHVGDRKKHGGAGPPTINPKSISVATFRDLESQRLVTDINVHMLASWTRTEEYLGHEEYLARRAYGRRQITLVLREIAKVEKGLINVTGDFNADMAFDLMRRLRAKVFYGDTGPTHGHKRIDYVGEVDHHAIRGLSWVVLDGYSSDHKPLLFTQTVTKRHHVLGIPLGRA